jgi:hypothetical protein
MKMCAKYFAPLGKTHYGPLSFEFIRDWESMPELNRKTLRKFFSLSVRGEAGKNIGYDEGQEMLMNCDSKNAADSVTVRLMKQLVAIMQPRAEVSRAVQRMFPSTRKRRATVSSAGKKMRRQELNMVKILKRLLTSLTFAAEGKTEAISLGNILAGPHVKESMRTMEEQCRGIWTAYLRQRGVRNAASAASLRRSTHSLPARKVGRVAVMAYGPSIVKKVTVSRKTKAKDNQLKAMKNVLAAIMKGERNRKERQAKARNGEQNNGDGEDGDDADADSVFNRMPDLLPYPPQLIDQATLTINKASKSQVKGVLEEHASEAVGTAEPRIPMRCRPKAAKLVDIALLLHRRPCRSEVTTYGQYAIALANHIFDELCAQDETGVDTAVLSLDIREQVGTCAFAWYE